MNAFEKYEYTFDKIKEWYVYMLVVYRVSARIVPFIVGLTPMIDFYIWEIFLWFGALLVVMEFFTHRKRYTKITYILLIAFIFVFLWSALDNWIYGSYDNLCTIVWTMIQIFILTSSLCYKGRICARSRIILRRVMNLTIFVWSIGVVISLVQFFGQSKYVVPNFSGTNKRQGFFDERLFGVFTDPNYAAITSLICVLFCLFLFKQLRVKWLQCVYIIVIVLNGCYIILSGSRTAYTAAITVFPIMTYYLLRGHLREKQKKYHLKSFCACGIVLAGICALYMYTPGMFADLAELTQTVGTERSTMESKTKSSKEQVKTNQVDVERKDTHGDISNNRIDIWKSVWEISGDKRFIGLSPRNLVAYAKINHPDSFIAKTSYEAHNGYLALISGVGILGTLPIAILFLLSLVWLFQYLYRHRGEDIEDILVIAVGVCVILAVSALFLLELFFTSTGTTMLFWIFFGTVFMYLTQEREEQKVLTMV